MDELKDLFKAIPWARSPFRGIYAIVARERGMTAHSVRQAAYRGDVGVLERLLEIAEQRKAEIAAKAQRFASLAGSAKS